MRCMLGAHIKKVAEMNMSMLNAVNEHHQKKVKENRNYIKTIASVLCLTVFEQHKTLPRVGIESLKTPLIRETFWP